MKHGGSITTGHGSDPSADPGVSCQPAARAARVRQHLRAREGFAPPRTNAHTITPENGNPEASKVARDWRDLQLHHLSLVHPAIRLQPQTNRSPICSARIQVLRDGLPDIDWTTRFAQLSRKPPQRLPRSLDLPLDHHHLPPRCGRTSSVSSSEQWDHTGRFVSDSLCVNLLAQAVRSILAVPDSRVSCRRSWD